MDSLAEASKYYEIAADLSPERNHMCNACSASLLCLSDMLDYMIKVTKTTEELPKLEYEIENWKNKLIFCREIYNGNQKGEAFIQSLDKLMDCIQNLYEYKKFTMQRDKRAFKECIRELQEVSNNIEGPLQKIIENSAKKMDIYRLKHIQQPTIENEFNHEHTFKANIFYKALKLINENKIISGTITGVAVLIIKQKYFP